MITVLKKENKRIQSMEIVLYFNIIDKYKIQNIYYKVVVKCMS